MLIAKYNNQRMRAENAGSGAVGQCPWTDMPVKAKVGEIRQFWAYQGGYTPPEGYENETEWHYNWKYPIQDEFCEVVCGENREHRADVIGNSNTVIEIQKSPIDIRIVRERIEFYKKLSNKRVIWVVDASDYWNKRLKPDFEKREGNIYPIIWKSSRQWVKEIAKTLDTNLFLDYNCKSDKLLQMWVFNGQLKGSFIYKTEFYKRYYFENLKMEYKENIESILKIWNE